jgi:hypothetical protein
MKRLARLAAGETQADVAPTYPELRQGADSRIQRWPEHRPVGVDIADVAARRAPKLRGARQVMQGTGEIAYGRTIPDLTECILDPPGRLWPGPFGTRSRLRAAPIAGTP